MSSALMSAIGGKQTWSWWRGIALAEAWKVRRDYMISCGKQGNKRIELARGGRKPVKQHDRRRLPGTSLPIEDADAIDRQTMIGRRSRC
jgi:hypothetical protein